MELDRIEQKIIRLIDEHAKEIIDFGNDIWNHAELSFQETRTGAKFAEAMEKDGLKTETGLALTGVKSYLKEQDPNEICLALIGELDALPAAGHKHENPETGAAHTCGHNAQITGVMGAAIALTDPEVREALGGNVVFMGVPSEEGSSSPEFKKKLMEEGKIRYMGGKCEFIRQGYMDGIDLAVGHHVFGDGNEYIVDNGAALGIVEKSITFKGESAHPAFVHKLVDAQAAAFLAVQAINAQREGFEHWYGWNQHIVHGVMTNGASASNIVVNESKLAYGLRAKTKNAIEDLSYRVDRAVKGAAIAMGAGLEIKTNPGYLPVIPVKDASVVEEVLEMINDGTHKITIKGPDDIMGTTDFGDLSHIMPVLKFNTCGHNGVPCHSIDWDIADEREYYLAPAKGFALLAYRLLKDNAARAKKIVAENPPILTAEEYVKTMESYRKVETIDMKPVPNFGLID